MVLPFKTIKALGLAVLLGLPSLALAGAIGRVPFIANGISAGWSPLTQFTDTIFWVDAHLGISTGGGNVLLSWQDQSPSANTVLPLTSFGPAPTFSLTGLEGKPTWQFPTRASQIACLNNPFLPQVPGFGYTGPQNEGNAFEYVGLPDNLSGDVNNIHTGLQFNIGTQVYGAGSFRGSGNGTGGWSGVFVVPQLPTYMPNGVSPPVTSFTQWYQALYYMSGKIKIILTSSHSPTNGDCLVFYSYCYPSGSFPGFFSKTVLPGVSYFETMWGVAPLGYSAGQAYNYGNTILSSPIFPSWPMNFSEHFISLDDVPNPTATAVTSANGMFTKWMSDVPNFVACVGDSLTQGLGLTFAQSYPAQLQAMLASKDVYNLGISGFKLGDMNIEMAYVGTQMQRPTPLVNMALVWGGTNDIANGASGATAYASLQTLVATLRANGWTKIVVMDCIPRQAIPETQRQTFNALIASGWSSFADGFVQLTAQPAFSSPTSWTDLTYYQSDGTHLTQAGETVVANAADAIVAPLL